MGRLAAEHGAQRPHLDGVAERGAGAVGLDIAHALGVDTGVRERQPDHVLLGRPVGRREPAALAVLVHRRAADHRQDPVAVGLRVREALEHDDAAALAADEAVGPGVERSCSGRREPSSAPWKA